MHFGCFLAYILGNYLVPYRTPYIPAKMAAAGQEVAVTEEVQARSDHSRRSSDEHRILINRDECRRCHARSSSDDDWLRCLQAEKHAATPRNKPKIQKVPARRREVAGKPAAAKRYYDPLVVSIGPIHHGEPHLQAMEKVKRQLAKKYADACHEKKRVDMYALYDKVEEVSESARSCYADGLTEKYDHKAFARMMFLDGCFVLQYIHSTVVGGGYPSELKMMKSHDVAFVRSDLLLLENQLPFEVLQVLMSCRFDGNEGMEMIDNFFTKLRPDPPIKIEHGLITRMKNLFLQLCFTYSAPKQVPSPLPTSAAHLLELLRGRLIKCGGGEAGGGGDDEWFTYRSVTELKKVGIKFCRGRERCLSDIRFESSSFHQSRLILPPVTIDDCSKSAFLNLVAYEACPDTPNDFGVSSYLCFMDSLIDDAEDVKELRSREVLFNMLGSDADVAELFNEISNDLVPNRNAYFSVQQQIQKHYKNKGRVWITEWKNTHFSSPWTVLAFLAAIFVIALDIFQTVLTYIQTFKKDDPCCSKAT